MSHKKSYLKGFILGVVTVVAVMMMTGAIYRQTDNRGGDTDHTFRALYASNDGKTVYACDDVTIYRSTDGGANWSVVFKKGKTSGM